MSTAPLDWILPDADPAQWRGVRRLVTLLRLVADEGRGRPAEDVATGWAPTRRELNEVARRERAALLEGLLAHVLAELRGPEGFLSLEAHRTPWDRAWQRLLTADDAPLAPVAPGESAARVAARLLAALVEAAPGSTRTELWRLRTVHLVEGPARALPGWCEAARGDAAFLEGELSCLLDLGRLEEARARLQHLGPRVGLSTDPSRRALSRRALWIHVLCGEVGRAEHRLSVGRGGRLPLPLVELARRVPTLGRFLDGSAAPGARPRAQVPLADLDELRTRVGARLAVVVGPAGLEASARPPHPWLGRDRARREACLSQARARQRDSAEARCLRSGVLTFEHALAPRRARARVLAPLPPAAPERPRWLLLEWSHHLVPAAAELQAAIAGLFEARAVGVREGRGTAQALPTARAGPEARRVAAGWVRSLGLGLSRRRVFVLGPPASQEPRALIHEEGGDLGDWRERPGTQASLRRASGVGRAVTCRPDPGGDGLHRASRAGLWMPLVTLGREVGLVGIESSRPGDPLLGPERESELAAFAAELAAAGFRDAHRELHGQGVHHDPAALVWRARRAELRDLCASQGAVIVRGPGRRVFTRWLAFARGGEPREAYLGDEVGVTGTSGRSAEPRVVVLPALTERRDELPGLLRMLVVRAAARAARPRPEVAGGLLALAFRQDWPGGVAELAQVATELVAVAATRAPDQPLREQDLAGVLARRGPWLRRLGSRAPTRHDLEAALRLTAHRRGTWNKCRAAELLGWNPETLRARLADHGLVEG